MVAPEQAELVRLEQLYRSQRPAVSLAGRTVIVVDDGLATGATMRAAVLAIRQQHPARDEYEKFPQASDDEVRTLLEEARREHELLARQKS